MQGLSQYGNGFLAKFEAAACPNQLLEEVTLVDTPGVLSGEKQRIEVRFAQHPLLLPSLAPNLLARAGVSRDNSKNSHDESPALVMIFQQLKVVRGTCLGWPPFRAIAVGRFRRSSFIMLCHCSCLSAEKQGIEVRFTEHALISPFAAALHGKCRRVP